MEEKKGIKPFIKAAVENSGNKYSEELGNKLLEKYDNNYDNIINDIGKENKVTDIDGFRAKIYEQYQLTPPTTPVVDSEEIPKIQDKARSFTNDYLDFDKAGHEFDIKNKELPKSQFDIQSPPEELRNQGPAYNKEAIIDAMPTLSKIEHTDSTWEGFGKELGLGATYGGNMLNQLLADAPDYLNRMLATAYNITPIGRVQTGVGELIGKDWKMRAYDLRSEKFADYTKDQQSIIRKKIAVVNPKLEEDILASAKNGDWITFTRNVSRQVAESTASSIAIMTAGAATGGVSMVGMGTVVFGAGKYREVDEAVPDMPEEKKVFIAGASGALEGLFETTFGSAAVGKAFVKLIANEGKDVAKGIALKGFRRGFSDLILKYPAMAPLGEGFEEWGTQITQNYVDKLSGYRPDIDVMEGSTQAFIIGAAAGASHGAIIRGARIGQDAVKVPIRRSKVKKQYEKSLEYLGDIPNSEYTDEIKKATESISDPYELSKAFDEITKNNKEHISEEDYQKALFFVSSFVQHGQMNNSRDDQIDENITKFQDNNGNVSKATIDGKVWYILNPQDIATGKVIFAKNEAGETKGFANQKVTEAVTKTPDEIRNDAIMQDEFLEQEAEKQKAIQDEADAKGIVVNQTAVSPHGKGTVISINENGTVTIADTKGDTMEVQMNEVEQFKTTEQKAAEKEQEQAEKDAQDALMEGIEEGAEIESDEEQSGVRIVNFNNGQSKVITTEKEQVFDTPEERDNAIKVIVETQIADTKPSLDDLSSEEAFEQLRIEDPESAAEIFQDEIKEVKTNAKQLRTDSKKSKSRDEKAALLKQARQLEVESQRLEDVLNKPEQQRLVNEAETLAVELQSEQENTPYNQLEGWQQEILGESFSSEQFANFKDKNEITATLAKSWLKKKGTPIDTWVAAWNQGIEEGQYGGVRITTEDVVGFIVKNPSKNIRSTTGRMNEIRAEYKDATGKSIDNHQAFIEESGLIPQATIKTDDPQALAYKEGIAKLKETGYTDEQIEKINETDEPGGVTAEEDLRAPVDDIPFRAAETTKTITDEKPIEQVSQVEGDVLQREDTKEKVKRKRIDKGLAEDVVLDISDKASEDINVKKRGNAKKALVKIANEFGIPIKVIHSSEISEGAKRKQRISGATPDAYYEDGVAYIISDQITSVSHAKESYLHESILHKGLDILFDKGSVALLGKEYKSKNELLMEMFNRMDEKTISDKAKEYGIAMEEGTELTDKQKVEISEEVLATLNQMENMPSRLKVFIDSLWKKIKKLAGFTSNQFTQNDFLNLLSEHRRLLKEVVKQETISKAAEQKLAETDNKLEKPLGEVSKTVEDKADIQPTRDLVEAESLQKVEPTYKGGEQKVKFRAKSEINKLKEDNKATVYNNIKINGENIERKFNQIIPNDLKDRYNKLKDEGYSVEAHSTTTDGLLDDLSKDEDDFEGTISVSTIGSAQYIDKGSRTIYVIVAGTPIRYAWGDIGSGNMEPKNTPYDEIYLEKPSPQGLLIPKYLEGYDYWNTLINSVVVMEIYEHENQYFGDIISESNKNLRKDIRLIDSVIYEYYENNPDEIDNYNDWAYDGVPSEIIDKVIKKNEDIRFRAQTETPEFKSWFGNSKVVDEKGEPLVVYHGTPYDFNQFLESEKGKRTDHSKEDVGFHFSNDPELSNTYAQTSEVELAESYQRLFGELPPTFDTGIAPSIMPTYLSIKNPFIQKDSFVIDKELINNAKENGYDGIMAIVGDRIEYVAFEPTQIKSATANIGTFDPESADIRFRVENKSDKATIVDDINKKHNWNYKISGNGRIYQDFMGKKQFTTIDKLMDRSEELTSGAIVSDNNRKVRNYLEQSGFKKQFVNKAGSSSYWNNGNITVRVSDHSNQSIYHEDASINAYSDEKDGYKDIITSIKLKQAASETDTNPSEEQKHAGNYKKGKFWMDGLNIAIENPEGSERHGNELAAHYGYIKGTIGADGDQIDVFIGEDPNSDKIFVIDQQKKNKRFDESKILISFTNVADAANAYLSSYDDGWQGMGSISETDINSFKEWLKDGNTTKRFKAGKAWSKVYPGISNLVANEGQMPEPKQQKVQVLREEGDKGLPSMDEKLQDISGGRRTETISESDTGQGGQQRGLQQEELSVGDMGSAVSKQEKRESDRIQGKEDVSKGVGRGITDATERIKVSDTSLQVDDRESIYYTRWKSKKKLEADNLQRGIIADVGDEQKAQRELRDTKESDLQGVERKRSDRRKESVKFRITEESTTPEIAALFERLSALEKVSKATTKITELEEEKRVSPTFEKPEIEKQIKDFKEGVKAGTKFTKDKINEIESTLIDYIGKNLDLGEAGARDIKSAFTAIKKARTPKSIQKAFDKIDELTGKVTSKATKNKHVAHIKRLMKWMKNTDKFVYANNVEFKKFRETDMETIKQQKVLNSPNSTEEQKIAADNELNRMWNELDTKVDERTMLENVQMKLIEYRRNKAEASDELVASIREDLQIIYDAAKDAGKDESIQKAIDRKSDREFVKGLIAETPLADENWNKRVRVSINNWTIDSMGNWETLLNQLLGQKGRDKFSFILNQVNQEVNRQATFDKVLDEAREAYGFKTKEEMLKHLQELKKKDFTLVKPIREGDRGQGKDQELSRMDIMDLYNAIKNVNIRNDAYMTYGDISLAEDGSRDTEAQKKTGKERIDGLIDKLTDSDKDFSDDMQIAVDSYYSKINEIFIKSKNRDLPKMDNYWPSSAEFANENDAFEQFRQDSMHPSATKERTTHRSVKVADAFDKFVNHVKSGEWYANMALPVTRMNNILKNPNVKDLIIEARGEEFYKTMIVHLQEQGLNPPSKAVAPTGIENVAGTVLNNWVTAAIGLSPSVPVKQLLSVINYSENMPVGKWAAGFAKTMVNPVESWKEMMKIPYLRTRIGTGYSEALQYVMNADSSAPKAASAWQKMKNYMTAGTRYGDIAAIVFGGKPYLDYLIDEKGMSYEDAVEQFLLDTLRSQQSPFSSSLSTWQNSKNVIKRSIFAFSNTPSQYQRKMFEANEAFKKGDIDKGQLSKVYAIYGVLASANYVIVGSLMSALLRGTDWDDDLLEKVLVQFGISAVGGIPIAKDIAEGLGRTVVGLDVYDDVSPILEGANKLISVSKRLANADEDTDKTKLYMEGIKYLTPFAGISSRNIEKVFKATVTRSKTFQEARTKKTDKHLTELAKPKRLMDIDLKTGNQSEGYLEHQKNRPEYKEAESASNMKSAYSSAKRKAKEFEGKGRSDKADRLTKLIETSKSNLAKTEYSSMDIESELKQFNRMLKIYSK